MSQAQARLDLTHEDILVLVNIMASVRNAAKLELTGQLPGYPMPDQKKAMFLTASINLANKLISTFQAPSMPSGMGDPSIKI